MAIKANELRIGNWLFFHQPTKTYNVKVSAFLMWHDLPTKNELFDPIPLTPEILQNSGFEPMDDGDDGIFYEKTHGEFTFTQGDKNGICEVVLDCTNLRVKFVHQLQNLFFCLTGEELTINL